MSDKDIFKQQRPPINPGEFDGGGVEEGSVDAMRSHLNLGQSQNQPSQPPTPPVMTGNIPPQIQQMMAQNHPLHPQQQQPPADDKMIMYQNAMKMMKQQQETPQPQFNPNFNPQQAVQRINPNEGKYAQFKDPHYEEVYRRLTERSAHYHEIELPSRGKFYLNGEGPGNGVLHIRPMTGREEQILTTPKFAKKNKSLNMIFKECVGEQIDPESLLSEDRTYMLIYLRGISYSPLYDVEVTCPACSKTFQTQIHLNSLDLYSCPDDFSFEDLTDTLPNSGLNIRYRFSTGRDEVLVQEHRDSRIKNWGADVTDDTSLFRFSLLIEDIEGINNKLMIQQLLEKLPIGDLAYLRELLNEPPFGVDTKVGIICPHCSHEFHVDMPMELGFFFPKPNLQKKKRQQG